MANVKVLIVYGESCVESRTGQQAGAHNVGTLVSAQVTLETLTLTTVFVFLCRIRRAVNSSSLILISLILIWCGLLRHRSLHRYGTAPFRHRLSICSRSIFDLPSQLSFAGAKSSVLGDNTSLTGRTRSLGGQGTGMTTESGVSVSWKTL